MLSLPIELDDLRKQLNLKVYIDGPANWSVRGLIEDVDEYVLATLDMILSENLPEDMEYEIHEDKNLCSIDPSEPDCEETLIVSLYRINEKDPIAYIVFNRVIGDNTYEFSFRKILVKT